MDLAETRAPRILFLSLLEECSLSHSRRWALNAACRNLQFLEHTVTRGPVPSALACSTVPIELKWPQTCYYPDSMPSVLAPRCWALQFYSGLRKWHLIMGHWGSGQRGRFRVCLPLQNSREGSQLSILLFLVFSGIFFGLYLLLLSLQIIFLPKFF